MFEIFVISIITVFVYMTLFFMLAQALKDNGIVDIGWGIGFIVLSTVLVFSDLDIGHRQFVLYLLVLIWGCRLALHIYFRNAGKPEDFRYANWRKEWGKYVVIRAFLQVFMLQGFFMLVIALPILMVKADANNTPLNIVDVIGILVWTIGFYFEAVGDYQMLQFKKQPENKGKIIMSGLWKYTRHPNYFGECVMWWGIFIISISAGNFYISIVSPIILTWLLTRVSGVPMLEEKYKGNKEWEAYAAKTNAFIPWFAKK
jgi:steroid 5-alpha reductase family enzyme